MFLFNIRRIFIEYMYAMLNKHQCHPSSISSIFIFNSSNEVSIPGSSNPPFSSIFCENMKRNKHDRAVLLLNFFGRIKLKIEMKEKRKKQWTCNAAICEGSPTNKICVSLSFKSSTALEICICPSFSVIFGYIRKRKKKHLKIFQSEKC